MQIGAPFVARNGTNVVSTGPLCSYQKQLSSGRRRAVVKSCAGPASATTESGTLPGSSALLLAPVNWAEQPAVIETNVMVIAIRFCIDLFQIFCVICN